jgi:hypothetical protein
MSKIRLSLKLATDYHIMKYLLRNEDAIYYKGYAQEGISKRKKGKK